MRPTALSPVATEVCDLLEQHIMAGWMLLMRESHARGIDATTLTRDQLLSIVARLGDVVSRMTDDECAADVMRGLISIGRGEAV
jgi:hypothetical protein